MQREDYSGPVVYFMQAGDDGPIKIGYCESATGVAERLKTLQTGCPWPIIVRRTMPVSGRRDEFGLHERFAEHRLAGEWFCPTRELSAFAEGQRGNTMSGKHCFDLLLASAYERGRRAGVEDGRIEGMRLIAARIDDVLKYLRDDDDEPMGSRWVASDSDPESISQVS